MHSFSCFLQATSSFIIGILIAFVGVAKPDSVFADEDPYKEPVFGNLKSHIEVYVVTDWFCPACRAAEGRITDAIPMIMKQAKLYFIDKVIHPQSMNYIPYNLSFMEYNKNRYMEIRRILFQMTDKLTSPTEEQIEAAVKPLGVKYTQLNYSDVARGMHFFETIVAKFDIHQTPTVVIYNPEKKTIKKLSGTEITHNSIQAAINEKVAEIK